MTFSSFSTLCREMGNATKNNTVLKKLRYFTLTDDERFNQVLHV